MISNRYINIKSGYWISDRYRELCYVENGRIPKIENKTNLASVSSLGHQVAAWCSTIRASLRAYTSAPVSHYRRLSIWLTLVNTPGLIFRVFMCQNTDNFSKISVHLVVDYIFDINTSIAVLFLACVTRRRLKFYVSYRRHGRTRVFDRQIWKVLTTPDVRWSSNKFADS